jgi:cytochrome c biogenesis protein CcmG/thiol:disulfide interchange protein DsbE
VRDRYSILVGLLFVAVVAIAILNGTGGGSGTLGLDRQPSHWPLPEFAIPRADSTLEGDANIAQDDCETSQLPCPDGARRAPACRVRVRGAVRVCDLFGRPSVISFFTGGGNCVAQQDVVSRVFERYRGRVAFLSVNLGDDRESVQELVRQRGWRMPVGIDRDGAVGALYRVGVCPTFAFAYPGGTLESASVGDLTAPQLSSRVEELLRATRAAEGGEPS